MPWRSVMILVVFSLGIVLPYLISIQVCELQGYLRSEMEESKELRWYNESTFSLGWGSGRLQWSIGLALLTNTSVAEPIRYLIIDIDSVDRFTCLKFFTDTCFLSVGCAGLVTLVKAYSCLHCCKFLFTIYICVFSLQLFLVLLLVKEVSI